MHGVSLTFGDVPSPTPGALVPAVQSDSTAAQSPIPHTAEPAGELISAIWGFHSPCL